MKKQKRIPLFWVLLLVFALLGAAAVQWVVSELKPALAAYEEAQPDRAAESVFRQYYTGDGTFAKLLSLAEVETAPGETEADARACFATLAENGLTYHRVSSRDDGIRRYVVMAGDVKVSAFQISRGEPVHYSFFGHDYTKLVWMFEAYRWQEDRFEVFLDGYQTASVTVTVPAGSYILLNGALIGEEYFTGDVEETASVRHMPAGVSGLTYRTYRVGGYFKAPTVRVVSGSGSDLPLTAVADNAYRAEVPYSESLCTLYGSRVLEAIEAYACFMQEDLNLGQIAGYFDTASALWANIKTTERFVWDHDGYAFENASADQFMSYGATVMSCRICFTHVLYQKKSVWRDEPTTLRVYLRSTESGWLIYDMTNETA